MGVHSITARYGQITSIQAMVHWGPSRAAHHEAFGVIAGLFTGAVLMDGWAIGGFFDLIVRQFAAGNG